MNGPDPATTHAQPPTQPPRHDGADHSRRSAPTADFLAVFAHVAQQTSRDAAANGRLALDVGVAHNPATRADQPGRLRALSDDLAQGPQDVRPAPSLSDRLANTHDAGTHAPAGRAPRGESTHNASPRPGTPPATRSGEPALPQAPDRAPHQPATNSTGAPSRAGAPGAPLPATPNAPAAPPAPTGSPAHAAAAPRSAAISSTSATAGVGPNQSRPSAPRAPAPRPAPPAQNPAHAARVNAQLASGLSAALRQGRGEATIRLRPDALGDVKVSLRVRDSVVDARIDPSTQQAHRLLEQSVGALRAALEARGLQVGKLEIAPPPPDHGAGGHPEERGDNPAAGGQREGQDAHDQTRGARDTGDQQRGGGTARSPEGDAEPPPEASTAHQGMEAPGVIYGVADGAARVLWIDALA